MTLQSSSGGSWLLSLGTEEALILLAPQGSFRRYLEGEEQLRRQTRFLVPADPSQGLLARFPVCLCGFLREPASHRVEWDLQEQLYGNGHPRKTTLPLPAFAERAHLSGPESAATPFPP